MKHLTPRPYLSLAALVAVALFPFGWLAEIWAPVDQIGGFIFGSEAAHAVGHTTIFALIGAALLLAFPATRRRPALYVAAILAVALGQEAFQLLYKARPVILNDITDIGTDLVAAGVVWALWYIWSKEAARANEAHHAQNPGRRG